MATGMEMLINAVMKAANVNPEDLKQKAAEAWQVVLDLNASLRRIEAKQDLILKHLGVTPDDANSGEPAGQQQLAFGDEGRS